MNKLSTNSKKRKPVWLLVGIVLLICLLGKYIIGGYNLLRLTYADRTKPQFRQLVEDVSMALPAIKSKTPVWLGILAPDLDMARTQNLWLVDFSEQGIQYQKVAVFKSSSTVQLVDCVLIPATLCAVSWSGSEENVYTLYRYNVLSSQTISETFSIPATLPDVRTDIISLTAQGKLLAQSGLPKTLISEAYKIYFHSPATTKTIFESTEDCMTPQLSPTGDWLAVVCVKDFLDARIFPFAEVEQHLYLARLDGSEVKRLRTPPTYYFHARTVAEPGFPRPGIPDYEWSQDGQEIIFAASFSPPRAKNSKDWLKYGSGVYPNDGIDLEFYGGIYSSLLEDGSLTKWADVGGWHPSLAWSPDQNYVAYTREGKLYMASRWGEYRQIELPDGFGFSDDVMWPGLLAWSPGGDYISIWRKPDQVWVLTTQDYSWQQLNIPMYADTGLEVIWITAPIP